MQDFSPIFIWLFLPITVDTKPFLEELKPDSLLGKSPFGLLLPAHLCSQSLASTTESQSLCRATASYPILLFADENFLPVLLPLPKAFGSIAYDIWTHRGRGMLQARSMESTSGLLPPWMVLAKSQHLPVPPLSCLYTRAFPEPTGPG